MSASFEGAVAWAHRRRVLVFAGAAVLLGFSFIGLRQITFDANVLRLLPARGEAGPAFRTFLDRFGTLDDLYVVFSAPEGHSIDEYDEEIDRWVEALRRVPELSRVDSGRPDPEQDWRWLLDRELLLLDDRHLAEALRRLEPAQEAQTISYLKEARDLLTLPSPEVVAMVREDPLGLHHLLRRQLAGQGGMMVGAGDEGYLSPDRRRRLIIARPAQPPYDTDFSHQLFDRLAAIPPQVSQGDSREELPALDVRFAGGHRIAVEAEAVVRRESIVNGAGSLALILPMLFVVFRSGWLVLIGAMPTALALVVVLGAMGLAGVTLSAAATGASAMLFGLGIDGVVLLYVAHHHAVAAGRTPEQAIRELRGPAASMLLGMWTTAATFLGLLVVDFPSLEQLGLLIGLSMVVCAVLTLLMVPASLSATTPTRRPRALAMPALARFVGHRRAAILIGAIAATVALGYFASTLRINFTLDRLRAVTPGAQMVQEVTQLFGLPGDAYVVLANGTDLQALLGDNEQLTRRVRRDIPDLAFQPASALLPSRPTQHARRERVRAAVGDADALFATITTAAVKVGFRPNTFDPFRQRLTALTDSSNEISYEGYLDARLQDVIGRFVTRDDAGWWLASYAFPTRPEELAGLKQAVAGTPGAGVLTGLPIVNEELGRGFMPQFALGLAVGTAIVLASIVLTFRNFRLSLLTLVPTAIGLTWAAGLLGLAGAELDIFSVFAVITFVGIGVDYGIHLVHRYQQRGDAGAAIAELAPVILVAGGITLFGYGTLISSSYPPLRSIGVVSAVSVVTLVAASVLVLPAMLQRRRG